MQDATKKCDEMSLIIEESEKPLNKNAKNKKFLGLF
jgi:hypothetical protein